MRSRWILVLALLATSGCGGDAGEAPEKLGGVVPVASSQAVVNGGAESQLDELIAADLQFATPRKSEEATAEPAGFQGPPPRRVRESLLPIDRSSPTGLLDSALAALLQQDVSALARLSRGRALHPHLNTDDAEDTRRRFLGPATERYWKRIAEAIRGGRYEVLEEGPVATVRVDVGGAAGSYRLRLRKEADEWYLAS